MDITVLELLWSIGHKWEHISTLIKRNTRQTYTDAFGLIFEEFVSGIPCLVYREL